MDNAHEKSTQVTLNLWNNRKMILSKNLLNLRRFLSYEWISPEIQSTRLMKKALHGLILYTTKWTQNDMLGWKYFWSEKLRYWNFSPQFCFFFHWNKCLWPLNNCVIWLLDRIIAINLLGSKSLLEFFDSDSLQQCWSTICTNVWLYLNSLSDFYWESRIKKSAILKLIENFP